MCRSKSFDLSCMHSFSVQISYVLSHIKLANDGVMKLFAKILRIRCKKLNETGQMGVPLFEFVKITIFYLQKILKFIYSEKATKFCKISTLLLSYVVQVKSKVEILQNFVAFSEYMNFKV